MRDQPVTIHRPTFEEDAYGNQVPSGVYTDILARAHRVAPVRARELTQGGRGFGGEQGQQTMIVSAVGAFPPGTDVRETDEVTANGKRYKVIGVFPVPSAMDPSTVRYVRADLEEVT